MFYKKDVLKNFAKFTKICTGVSFVSFATGVSLSIMNFLGLVSLDFIIPVTYTLNTTYYSTNALCRTTRYDFNVVLNKYLGIAIAIIEDKP